MKRLILLLLLLAANLGAVQIAVPTSDNTDGAWVECVGDGDADHFDEIDETIAATDNATTFWSSDNNVTALVTNLGPLTDPVSSTGHTFRVRSRKASATTCTSGSSNGGNLRVVVTLKQSTTTIASFNSGQMNSTWKTWELTLSGAQADAITDYTALNITVFCDKYAGGNDRDCALSTVEFEVPDASAGGARRRSSVSIIGE